MDTLTFHPIEKNEHVTLQQFYRMRRDRILRLVLEKWPERETTWRAGRRQPAGDGVPAG